MTKNFICKRFRSQRGVERERSGGGSGVDSGMGTPTRFRNQRARKPALTTF